MKLLGCITTFALISLLDSAAISDEDDDELVFSKEFYLDGIVKYTTEFDIVNILVPLNSLNFDETSEDETQEKNSDVILFFVESNLSNGSHIDKGLYVLKEGNATKLLEYGRDAAASCDDSKLVFFGAQDGIYVYNFSSNTAEKYGTISDSIIAIAKEKSGDVIYILTEDHDVYKVSNNGETKTKLNDVVNAQEIVLDYANNLYFFSVDKKPYVRTADGVKQVEGLPDDTSDVKLIKPPLILEESVPFIVGDEIYILNANGTSEVSPIRFKAVEKPTAYALEATLVLYYAHNKIIYELNIPNLLHEAVPYINRYLNSSKASEIRKFASKNKGEASHIEA